MYEWVARMHSLHVSLSIAVRLSHLHALWDKHYHGATLLLIQQVVADEEVHAMPCSASFAAAAWRTTYHILTLSAAVKDM